MIILLAAVSSIPKDLLEAARLDGANRVQVLKRVIIPLIKPVIVNLMILCFIGKMKVFDLIWSTTQGGPMWSTETVATYTVKRAFYWNTFEKGYPSAMASMWFIIILVISLAVTRMMQKKEALEY
jgi:ABC-type sugar transport system permease subunit